MHALAHEFTNRKVSPWGGIKYYQQTYERSGLRDDILDVGLPEGGANRALPAIDLVEGFMVSMVLGSKRMTHTGRLKQDDVIREIFGWEKGIGSQSTYSRFFRRFDTAFNDTFFTAVMRRWWDEMSIKKMTIDIDSTVISRYGNQDGAEVGYNPNKKGRPSHHPLMAFCDELQMVVNAWMRPGNTHDTNGMDCFLEQLLEIVPAERIGLLRADSGFYSNEVMCDLEEAKVKYIIRAKMTSAMMTQVLRIKEWYSNDTVCPGAFYAEIEYKGTSWFKSRRAVVVRRPKAAGPSKQEAMFEEDNLKDTNDFFVYITTSELSCVEIHALYNRRGDCENRIKELKYDYCIDGFCMDDINATEAALRFIMLAYNVMSLFKQQVMQSRVRHQLSTIRFQCIAIGSYLTRNGRNKVLKLAAEGKRRHYLEHVFDNVELLKPPFKFSNA
jgi:hypothetical protein